MKHKYSSGKQKNSFSLGKNKDTKSPSKAKKMLWGFLAKGKKEKVFFF